MAKTVSTLAVSFTAKTSKFTKGVNKMKRDLKKIKAQVAGFAKMSIGITVVGAAAAFTALTKLADGIDDVVKDARRLNILPDQLRAIQHAAALADGAGVSVVKKSLRDMSRRASEAADGVGNAAKAFDMLGIDAKAFNQLNAFEQFKQLADALSGVKNHADAVRIAYDIGGRSMVEMINTLKAGSESINAAEKDVLKLARTFDEGLTSKVEAMNDEIERIKLLFQGVAEKVVMLVAGPMTELIQKFIEAKTEGGGIGIWVDEGIATAILAIRDLLNALEYLKAGWQGFRAIVITVGSVITKAIAGWIMLLNTFRNALGMSSVGGSMLAVDRAMQQAHVQSVAATETAFERAGSGAAGKEFMDAIYSLSKSTDANTQATQANAQMFEQMLKGGLVNQQTPRDYVRGTIIPELIAAGR
jgi:hypothetical protein